MNANHPSGEKININNICFEDSFIALINKLSKAIQEYYHPTSELISKSINLIPLFEKNINQMLSILKQTNVIFTSNNQNIYTNIDYFNSIKNEYKSIAIKSEENLKSFIEKSKIIFKEMKNKKNSKLEEIYNDYALGNTQKINQKNEAENSNLNQLRFSHQSKANSNSQKPNRQRNKTNNKGAIVSTNINKKRTFNSIMSVKTLAQKMSEYVDIISTYSNDAKENYLNLQKQILYEVNKSLMTNTSKSVEKKTQNQNKSNSIPTYNNINVNNNIPNPFIMVNNNSNNVTLTTTNNNSYYNIVDNENIKDLKSTTFNRNSSLENYISNNNDLIQEINNLKLELQEANNKNKNLENKIKELDNMENLKKNEKNTFDKYKTDTDIKIKSLENENNELKKQMTLILEKNNNENNKKDEPEKEESHKVDESEIKKLKEEMENKTKEYEENIKKLNEQIDNQKKENEKMNDENTSLSKFLADKNREIQLLQNSNKLKINELNKLKLIVKTNEKQLKVKKLKAEQKKANSPNNLKIKDLLGNSQKIHDINSNSNNNSPNVSTNHENNNIFNKETITKLEEEIKDLKEEIEKAKEEIEKAKEEKESLTTNISSLEKDISNKINEYEILENELNNKNNKIEDENKVINELKSEKDKLILKLKEYKNSEELYLSQIKILKEHIKKLEKQLDSDKNVSLKKKELIKKISDLEIEITNIKMQLEIELKFNGQLKNNLKSKSEQIDELNLVINDLMKEKEKFTLMKSSSQIHNIQNKVMNNDNKNSIFNRSKTKEESDRVKVEDNVKKSVNKNVGKEKEKEENNSHNMECKTDKNLEKYKLNEHNKNEKENDDFKSEDMKVDFNKN